MWGYYQILGDENSIEDLMAQIDNNIEAPRVYLKSKKGFGKRSDLFFVQFGLLRIRMRFKHFLYYLKLFIHKIKAYYRPKLIIKQMPCNKTYYIKRKKNKS